LICRKHKSKKRSLRLWLFAAGCIFGLTMITVGQTAQAIANGGYTHAAVMIQPDELKDFLNKRDPNIRIIDIHGKREYPSGHIPGAVHVWPRDITDKNHPIPGMMAPKNRVNHVGFL